MFENIETIFYLNLVFGFLTLIIDISMIVMGAMFKNDCPIDERIPIWNIVYGSAGLGFFIVNFYINM